MSDVLPLISVVVPVRNDAQRLRRCLASVQASNYPADRVEILVADNGSWDTSPEVAQQMRARLLHYPDIRVSEVRNQAARAARGEILIFVDADHELDSDWIPQAVEDLRTTAAGAVGAAYHAPPDGTWVQRLYDSFRRRTPGVHSVEWLGSGSLAVWRNVFERIGGFDSTLETCEDVDFCQRLRGGNFALYSDDRLRSVHLGDPRSLRALFFGELWRGRDNLKVSLRGPLSLRGLPSVLIPIANLALLIAALIGLVRPSAFGREILWFALAGIAALTMVRLVRMLTQIKHVTLLTIPRAFVVAFVYEIARALALVVRTPHSVRQQASLASSIRERRS